MNTIYLTFDRPVTISAISFWNYTKNPERGVKEIAIGLDEHIIYKVEQFILLLGIFENRKELKRLQIR